MAVRDGATVIATVRTDTELEAARTLGAHHAFLADATDLAQQVRFIAPDRVHRIAEVDFADHIELDAEIIAIGGVIASYFSSSDRPAIPYWSLGFGDATLRLLGSDDFAPAVKADAAARLTEALVDGSLRVPVAKRLPLEDIAQAHELVERGHTGRIILQLT